MDGYCDRDRRSYFDKLSTNGYGVRFVKVRQAHHERLSYDMSFHVYILKCADGSYYTGHTDDLEKRIGEHRSGQADGYTKTRLPVSVVYSENFPTRLEALEAEQRIKGWRRAKKEALIAEDWERLKRLSKSYS